MSVRSDLMVQQYHVAKKDLETAISGDYNGSHDIASHALAQAIYRIDRNKVESITVRDRAVVYSYILRRIEELALADAKTPEEMVEGINNLFVECIDDMEIDMVATENYAKPLSGLALAIVELLDVTEEVADEVADEVEGILPEPNDLAVEVLADFIEITRNNEKLLDIKNAIEEL